MTEHGGRDIPRDDTAGIATNYNRSAALQLRELLAFTDEALLREEDSLSFVGNYLTDYVRLEPARLEGLPHSTDERRFVLENQAEPNAHVEDTIHLSGRNASRFLNEVEDRLWSREVV